MEIVAASDCNRMTTTGMGEILARICADERYRANLDWGEPRPGHPEGTVRAHIAELEQNLVRLGAKLSEDEQSRLRLVIHTHDTFKPDAKPGVPITHPQSHASQACQFLSEFCHDEQVLQTVQFHDEPYALWRLQGRNTNFDQSRFESLLVRIRDWDLFLAFQIIDGCTAGKSREPLIWFFSQIEGRMTSRFSAADLW